MSLHRDLLPTTLSHSEYEGRLSPGRTVLSASCPDRHRPAALPCAPTRLACSMSEFWIQHVIEHKRCLTGGKSQQQNQSQNRPVQNPNTSHAAEACQLRAGRRAEYASVDAPGACRRTCQLCAGRRAGLRRETRRVSAPKDAASKRAEAREVCASARAGQVRRCARSTRVGAPGACASVRA